MEKQIDESVLEDWMKEPLSDEKKEELLRMYTELEQKEKLNTQKS